MMRPRFPVASGDQQRPTPPQQLRPSPMRPVPMQQHHYNWSSTRSQQQQQQQHQHQRNRVPSPFMTPEARRNMLSMASPPMRASATTYFDSTSNSPPPSSATQMMRYINVRVAVAADSPFYNRNDEGDDGRAELNHHPHHSTDFPPTTPRASPVPCISPLTVSSETATNRRKATGSGFPYNAFVPIGENEQQQQQLPSSRLSSPASWVTRSLEASPSVFSSSIYNDHDDYDNDDDSVYFLPSFEHHGTTATAHLNKQQKQAFSPSLTAETSSVMTMDQNSIKSNLFASLAAPPVYQDQQQSPRVVSSIAPPPGMSSLAAAAAAGRCRPSSAITTPPLPKKVWMSSLAAAAAAGRSGVEIQSTSCASSTPTSALNRPHSAPTLGRPTIVDNSSSSDCKNEGDDSPQLLRKTRIKTELCLHYVSGRPCPFGANCTYAHGEEELQMTKLLDLHEAGLVDVETYRTKPCLTWITTGSCPFGKRCTGIHDYRVSSSASQSWLPHTETQGNTIATDINVDGLHQKRLHTILYDNPFGDQFTLTSSSSGTWEDLYGLVCGDFSTGPPGLSKKDGWIAGGSNGNSKRTGRQIHAIYKLQIALKMRANARGIESDWQYKFRPQHIIHEELCMVLQKRAFRVTGNDHTGSLTSSRLTSSTATATSSVVEISLNVYNPRLASHILVHEIAFGPDSDPSVRGVALWFNIAESEVTVCTHQQAKRFRWKKSGNASATKRSFSPSSSTSYSTLFEIDSSSTVKPSVFDLGSIDSFPMIRPHDDAAFRLATDMMKHRLAFLKRERMSSMKDRFEALQKFQRQEVWLKERFENQRRMWFQWAWPVNAGRGVVDFNTPVPPVEGPYLLDDCNEMTEGQSDVSNRYEFCGKEKEDPVNFGHLRIGANVHHIWDSFVETSLETSTWSNNKHATASLQSTQTPRAKRLIIFEKLAYGQPIDPCRTPPHITKHYASVDKRANNSNRQQERCWKALLLKPESSHERNEWDVVREHFENSRSKKVLSIIQR